MFNFLSKSTTNETNKRITTTSDICVKAQNSIHFSADCLSKIQHKPGNYIYIGKVIGSNKIVIASLDAEEAKKQNMGRPLTENNSFTNKNLSDILKGSKSEWNVGELVSEEEGCIVYNLNIVVSGEDVEKDLEETVSEKKEEVVNTIPEPSNSLSLNLVEEETSINSIL